MADSTTYYGMVKPLDTEKYSIDVFNENADIIDAALKALQDAINNNGSLTEAKEYTDEKIGSLEAPEFTTASVLSSLLSGEDYQILLGKLAKAVTDLISHLADKSNPHGVDKSQLGLGNVDNTTDMDKPVSAAQQTAIDTAVSEHNVSSASHDDIRNLIAELTKRLNALADSDDETLDQMSEIVSYIKNNKDLIEGITTDKVNVSDIIDVLTSTEANKPLSANQGRILKGLIDTLQSIVDAQYAFSNVSVGSTDIEASSMGDSLTLESGEKIAITPDSENNKITFEHESTTRTDSTSTESPAFGGTFTAVKNIASDATGHVTSADTETVAIPDSVATASDDGLMSSKDKAKLDGIASGAQVNQNAFGSVAVGDVTIMADSETCMLTLAAGSNVTLTPDAANGKITVESSDTVYTHPSYTAGTAQGDASKTLSFGGTFTIPTVTYDAQGHVTAKGTTTMTMPANPNTDTHYTSKNVVGSSTATSNTTSALTNGNVYLNSVENGSVTSAHKISGSGATTVTTDTSGNIVITSTDTNTNTTYSAGTGLSLSGTTFSLASGVVTAASAGPTAAVTGSNGTTVAIPRITVDTYGRVTGLTSYNLTCQNTDTNTDTKVTQTLTSTSANYPLLLAPTGQTATATTTALFGTAFQANPSTGTLTATTFSGALSGNATTATTATKLGSSTVGGAAKPIYLSSGTATACSSTVGSGVIPTYMNSGTITASTSTVGDANTPVYLNAGTITTTGKSFANYLPLAGGTMTGTLKSSAGGSVVDGTITKQFYGTMGANDYWSIGVGATASDSGFMELATGDNGNEPIYVRQYSSTTLTRTLTLLDGSGNSTFPGTVTASTFSGALSGNASTATKLATARTITLNGDVTGSGSFDGSGNLSIATTVSAAGSSIVYSDSEPTSLSSDITWIGAAT